MFGSGTLNAGTVYARIAVDNTGAMAGLRTFNSALEQTERQGQKSFGAVLQRSEQMSRTLTIIGVAGAAVALQMVKLAASYQQTEIAMTTMLKSSDLAKQKLAELRDFALKTPFQFTQLTQITRLMLAYKFSAEELIPVLRDVGDATAGLGGEPDRMQRIVVALGQIQAKGKMTAEEMLQLAENGVSAWTYVGDAMGKTTAEVMKMSQKGLIPAKLAIDAIREGMRSDFGGMMADQAKTTAGQFSNLVDYSEKLAVTMGSMVLPTINKFLAGATNLVTGLDGLSTKTKSWVASLAIGLPVFAIGTAALLNMPRALFGADSAIGAFKVALQAKQVELAKATAANIAHSVTVSEGAVVQMRAAQAAMEEAIALEEMVVASGNATAADLAFLEAEKAKAVAMARNAQLASEEGMALTAAANTSRFSFLGLSAASWTLIGVLGALMAAWVLYSRTFTEKADKNLKAAERERASAELALRADKEKAAELRGLAKEYDQLSTKHTRSHEETLRLHNITSRLTEMVGGASRMVNAQTGVFNGNTTAVLRMAGALDTATQAQLRLAKAMANEELRNVERQLARTANDASDIGNTMGNTLLGWAGANFPTFQRAVRQAAQNAPYKNFKLFKTAPNISEGDDFISSLTKLPIEQQRYLLDTVAPEYRDQAAKLELLLAKRADLQEQLNNVGKPPKPITYPVPKPGVGGAAAGGKSTTAKPPTAEEIHRAYIQRREDIISTLQAEEEFYRAKGNSAQADAKHNLLIDEQTKLLDALVAGMRKYGMESEVGLEDRRKLAALNKASLDRAREDAEKAAAARAAAAESDREIDRLAAEAADKTAQRSAEAARILQEAADARERDRQRMADFNLKYGFIAPVDQLREEAAILARLVKGSEEWRQQYERIAELQAKIADDAERAAKEIVPLPEIIHRLNPYDGSPGGPLEDFIPKTGAATPAESPVMKEARIAGQAFGQALWNFQRDRSSVKSYFQNVIDELGRRQFDKVWEKLFKSEAGNPSVFEKVFGNVEGRLPVWARGARGQRNLERASGVYAAYSGIAGSSTTDTGTGAREGALSGLMAGAAWGPWGAAAGALFGGLFGASEAAKRQHEEAQRKRDAMLSELRKMNNALIPVSDFFRQGLFGTLPGAMTWGGGGLSHAYAIETSRGAR